MTEAEEISVKNDIRDAIKRYSKLKLRDMSNEISAALHEAAQSAQLVERDQEDNIFAAIEQKYGPANQVIIKEVKAMLDAVDAQHTAIIQKRDAAINAIVNKYLNEPPEPMAEGPAT